MVEVVTAMAEVAEMVKVAVREKVVEEVVVMVAVEKWWRRWWWRRRSGNGRGKAVEEEEGGGGRSRDGGGEGGGIGGHDVTPHPPKVGQTRIFTNTFPPNFWPRYCVETHLQLSAVLLSSLRTAIC